eukprot:scaffold236022_cov34-Prasinocladus_malaysianus.AAC.1
MPPGAEDRCGRKPGWPNRDSHEHQARLPARINTGERKKLTKEADKKAASTRSSKKLLGRK